MTTKQDDNKIKIEFAAVINDRRDSGYIPQVWNNGRPLRSPWMAQGTTLEDATAAAKDLAWDEFGRYAGDWDIDITPR